MLVPRFKHFTPKSDLETLAAGLPSRLADLAPKGSVYALAIEKDERANYHVFIKISSPSRLFTAFETAANPKSALIRAEGVLRKQLEKWNGLKSGDSAD